MKCIIIIIQFIPIEIDVLPSCAFSNAFCTNLSLFASNALVASSKINTLGFLIKALATDTRCF